MVNDMNKPARVSHVVVWGCIASANATDATWACAAYIALGAFVILASCLPQTEPQP